ncbi:MAG: DUF2490 domain-containing protein [Daejeonella sp.]|uniref:DUF2490 domain-containing protein n=1 Tax=Daejeonella sp. JGW-45 TaxID=3034148 RepID=UPI0023EDB905|nr:DUF2490 domain-containing protein [Daejeonella sp. JGW-45]
MKKTLLLFLFCSLYFTSYSQNTRLKDKNSIGWYAFNASLKLDPKWSLTGEFQWRRDHVISDPQQAVYKLAVNHLVAPGLNIRAGVALADTYNYGDIPVNGMGKQFTEYRTYQMAGLSNKTGIAENNHRFMLEQRWVGRYSDASLNKEDEYVYTNRFRYMYRLQIPLKGKAIADNTPYAAVYDEIFIGFGENVGENVFDQNRFGLLLGYRFSPQIRIEGGFLSQIAQFGREINGRNVFQHNRGIILSTNLSF